MNYKQSIDFIHSRRKFAKDGSLNRINALLNAMGNPHEKLNFIHVVGTNGKGSTCTYMSEALQNEGYKVGLFTSPFVLEFGERIRINGEMIEHESLIEITSELESYANSLDDDTMQPNVFEFITVLALTYFFREKSDIVVLEAGIGGEHDSTNVIPPPLLTVLTSISIDHTNLLGDTVEEIASEKCGAIKANSFAVSYPNENSGFDFLPQKKEVVDVIEKRCKLVKSELMIPDISTLEIISQGIEGTVFMLDGMRYETHLMGQHQIANAVTAITALKALRKKGIAITDKAISCGIAKAKMLARMQVASQRPLTILDGGHNEGCMTEVANLIQSELSDKKITMIMTFVKGKDFKSAMDIILPFCDTLILTPLLDGSNEDLSKLESKAKTILNDVVLANDSHEALAFARKNVKSDEVLLVVGSFYLVGEVEKYFSARHSTTNFSL